MREDNAEKRSASIHLSAIAHLIMQRCDLLAVIVRHLVSLTRRFASSEMQQVNAIVADWMRAAGMSVEYDAVGNLIGRYESDQPGLKPC